MSELRQRIEDLRDDCELQLDRLWLSGRGDLEAREVQACLKDFVDDLDDILDATEEGDA